MIGPMELDRVFTATAHAMRNPRRDDVDWFSALTGARHSRDLQRCAARPVARTRRACNDSSGREVLASSDIGATVVILIGALEQTVSHVLS
jgi:hypothetical protein